MDSSRDFDLLGESGPQVRVSARTLALSGFFICKIYIYMKKKERDAVGQRNIYIYNTYIERRRKSEQIMMKNPRRARVSAETRTCGTDSPRKSKSNALPITPTHRTQKRPLDDGLQAHAIRPTRESLEDVTRTLDAPPSKGRSEDFFFFSPSPQRATSQTVENSCLQGAQTGYIQVERRRESE